MGGERRGEERDAVQQGGGEVSRKETNVTVSPFGCFGVIIGGFLAWALIFGVTIDGKHYGTSCSCNNGVSIDRGVTK